MDSQPSSGPITPTPDAPDTPTGPRANRFHQRDRKRLHFRWPQLSRKQWAIVGIVALLVAGGGFGVYWKWFHHPAKKPAVVIKKKPAAVKPAPAPQPVSTLTGLPVSNASVNDRPVTAVMIENSLDARPQSALDQAGVVFEAIAEGGITRFLTLFQDSAPSYIGPVRSVRPYYVQWLMGFDAAVAHVGGSGEALQNIRSWGVKDLDQFANGKYYHRITSRYAPHNVYTSMAELNALEAAKGYGKPHYTGFVRKPEAPSKTPTATSVDFAISSYYYNVHYDYNAATNSYLRSEGGAPHKSVDGAGVQTQNAPKVVVGLVMPQGRAADDLHTSYNTIGSGPAFVFQDGTVTNATWHKAGNAEQFTFTNDADGSVVKLNPGQTWLTVLGKTSYITYK